MDGLDDILGKMRVDDIADRFEDKVGFASETAAIERFLRDAMGLARDIRTLCGVDVDGLDVCSYLLDKRKWRSDYSSWNDESFRIGRLEAQVVALTKIRQEQEESRLQAYLANPDGFVEREIEEEVLVHL